MQPVIRFYPLRSVEDGRLVYAVIAAQMNGLLVLCRHRDRSTWECPGGHIEPGESPLEAAQRELYEETGAEDPLPEPVCVYSITFADGPETFGLLCRAELASVGPLPACSEMSEVRVFQSSPESWTYPMIQPFLIRHALRQSLYEASVVNNAQT